MGQQTYGAADIWGSRHMGQKTYGAADIWGSRHMAFLYTMLFLIRGRLVHTLSIDLITTVYDYLESW